MAEIAGVEEGPGDQATAQEEGALDRADPGYVARRAAGQRPLVVGLVHAERVDDAEGAEEDAPAPQNLTPSRPACIWGRRGNVDVGVDRNRFFLCGRGGRARSGYRVGLCEHILYPSHGRRNRNSDDEERQDKQPMARGLTAWEET